MLAIIPPNLHPFVDALEHINIIYTISLAMNVAPNHREVTRQFEDTWRLLMREFNVTMPLKVHIIISHLSEYF